MIFNDISKLTMFYTSPYKHRTSICYHSWLTEVDTERLDQPSLELRGRVDGRLTLGVPRTLTVVVGCKYQEGQK